MKKVISLLLILGFLSSCSKDKVANIEYDFANLSAQNSTIVNPNQSLNECENLNDAQTVSKMKYTPSLIRQGYIRSLPSSHSK